MAIKKKKKQQNTRYMCNICGTAYKSKMQQRYCNKMNCQRVLSVGDERLRLWQIETYTICCVKHLSVPISCGAVGDDGIVSLAKRLNELSDTAFVQCKSYEVFKSQAIGHQKALSKIIRTCWPVRKGFKVSEALATLACVVRDVLLEVSSDNAVVWSSILGVIKKMVELYDLSFEDIDDIRNEEHYLLFRRGIFSDELKEKPKAYDVEGRCVVIARSKQQAIEQLTKELGLVVSESRLNAMDYGTKLESADGFYADTVENMITANIVDGKHVPFVLTT